MEPIEGSETSAYIYQTPGNYPKENLLYPEHGESLKSRIIREHYAEMAFGKHIFRYKTWQECWKLMAF
jgi:hypothetical protein